MAITQAAAKAEAWQQQNLLIGDDAGGMRWERSNVRFL
jgi:phage-related tail fiber protein